MRGIVVERDDGTARSQRRLVAAALAARARERLAVAEADDAGGRQVPVQEAAEERAQHASLIGAGGPLLEAFRARDGRGEAR
jgi:hypothetical protein